MRPYREIIPAPGRIVVRPYILNSITGKWNQQVSREQARSFWIIRADKMSWSAKEYTTFHVRDFHRRIRSLSCDVALDHQPQWTSQDQGSSRGQDDIIGRAEWPAHFGHRHCRQAGQHARYRQIGTTTL